MGFNDWQIIEASSRIGGRVHTAYLDGTAPDEYQYQEMGPMRFPVSLTIGNETIDIQDHKMVFQLVEVLNTLNGNNSEYVVNFIECVRRIDLCGSLLTIVRWIQTNVNVPADTSKRLPNGLVPSVAEVNADPSLADNITATYSNVTAVTDAAEAYTNWLNLTDDRRIASATNVFAAHKKAVEAGYLDFSEAGYIKYVLDAGDDITDQIDTLSDNYDSWYYETVYFEASYWRTIDQGLDRLPLAFMPLVENRTLFQTAVQELSYNNTTDKVSVGYRPDPFQIKPETIEFDYVLVSVPFAKVRIWTLPDYSSLLSRAINTLQYKTACKVALKYETRFWEHLEVPILGGCASVNIPSVVTICYPSYNLNGTGPGVLLASYNTGFISDSVSALTDIEHVALVQRAIVEVHGQVAQDQFTGSYARKCWSNDEYQAGDWYDTRIYYYLLLSRMVVCE